MRVAGNQAVQGKGATCSMVKMQPYSQVYTGDSPIGSGRRNVLYSFADMKALRCKDTTASALERFADSLHGN